MEQSKTTAIIVAAGSGKRMASDIPKQYLLLEGKPILYYTLKAFENSSVSDIVLVVGKNDIDYCRHEIVEKYGIQKIKSIVEGGKERYHSSYHGLMEAMGAEYVLIHDGARPFITREIIDITIQEVMAHKACIVGVPAKDTIKLVNEHGFVYNTPNRDTVWAVQTPQAFSYNLILAAYTKLLSLPEASILNITDDAMVVEHMMNHPVKLVMGSYRNIKITTPEDLVIGSSFLEEKNDDK
ncbi:MAG: 2-C-methyl-D-erythritol 4-phosphate cytidylyltransferase [Anaerocolumna sp.]|jgi:2-C-methyl-D-erythritol 4-phosphate cytidylyltransferase|nr:2-C-methyl-D-erythritol 4-phosphate cytidylyltransferase [Anaerocolumna sp.]